MKYAPDKMYGSDVQTFAAASRWMDWEQTKFLPEQHILVMNLVRLPPDERDPAAVEEARISLLRPLGMLEDQLSKTAWWLETHFRWEISRLVCAFTAGFYSISNRRRCRTWHVGTTQFNKDGRSKSTSRMRRCISLVKGRRSISRQRRIVRSDVAEHRLRRGPAIAIPFHV